MKTGFSTNAYVKKPLDYALKSVSDIGYDGVEIVLDAPHAFLPISKLKLDNLKKNPTELQILGDGGQSKDYIYIEDCIDGILHAYYNTHERINVFNLSSGTTITVKEIAQIILEEMNMKNVKLKYITGPPGWEGEGWIGEIRSFHYDISKIKKTGWSPKLSSHEAVRLSVRETIKNNHVQ